VLIVGDRVKRRAQPVIRYYVGLERNTGSGMADLYLQSPIRLYDLVTCPLLLPFEALKSVTEALLNEAKKNDIQGRVIFRF
jgi:hypothetical protein